MAPTGIYFSRHYTRNGQHPYDTVEWGKRDCVIKDHKTGKVVFEARGLEFPTSWSDRAVDIAGSKYLRKAGVPETGSEVSLKQLINRIVLATTEAAHRQGMFADADSKTIFSDELTYVLLHQIAAFNSPVWFNLGLSEAYRIRGHEENFCWDFAYGVVTASTDDYARPQLSACFILSVEDSLQGIQDTLATETRLFRNGSGVGWNCSPIRGKGEKLSAGGSSSGVMSFLSVFDRNAGSIKSGGVTRRAAKLVCMDMDHPDIEAFIDWKVREEKKAQALIAAGYPSDFNGEAYATVDGQNSNNSVQMSDAFMEAVHNDAEWQTRYRTTGEVASTHRARDLWNKIAQAAWQCADPGVQFSDAINKWNTHPASGKIVSSNPCVKGSTRILTRQGYRRIDALVGQLVEVWNGQRWSAVTPRVTGHDQPMVRVKLSDGTFLDCTPAHVWCIATGELGSRAEERVKAEDLRPGDPLVKYDMPLIEGGDDAFNAYAHGFFCGDGHYENGLKKARLFGVKIGLCERLGVTVPTTGTDANKLVTLPQDMPEKFEVPLDKSVRYRLAWFAGLLDADGSVIKNPGSLGFQIGSVNLEFLQQTRLMLTTLGVQAKIGLMHAAADRELPDGRGGKKTYHCQDCYRLVVSAVDVHRLVKFGLVTSRLDLTLAQDPPQRDARRFVTVASVEELPNEPTVYCFTEEHNHTGTFEGIVTGQCGEFLCANDTSCNLCCLNLGKFWFDGVGDQASFDVDAFQHTARLVFFAQEAFVDYASYPTAQIAEMSHRLRPLGLGYANLGQVLMRAGLAYDSDKARSLAGAITSLMTATAYKLSADMAEVFGAWPDSVPVDEQGRKNAEAQHTVVGRHKDLTLTAGAACTDTRAEYIWARAEESWREAQQRGNKCGYRNCYVSLLMPAGTVGLLMDCDTTGIEPDFSLTKYKLLAGGGNMTFTNQSVGVALRSLGYTAEQAAAITAYVADHNSVEGAPGLHPQHYDVFDCASPAGVWKRCISPLGHVRMCAAVQPFISMGISKTINMPNSATVEDIRNVYEEAYRLGVKSVTVYRDGCKSSQPLSSTTDTTTKTTTTNTAKGPAWGQKIAMPARRTGFTQEAIIGGHKLYLRTGEYPDGTLGEIFIDMHKEGASFRSVLNLFAINTSMALQRGVPLEDLVEQFTFTRFEPQGQVEGDENVKLCTSVIDYVFRVLAIAYLGRTDLGHVRPDHAVDTPTADVPPAPRSRREPQTIASALAVPGADTPPCPACGGETQRTGACATCKTCGQSLGCG